MDQSSTCGDKKDDDESLMECRVPQHAGDDLLTSIACSAEHEYLADVSSESVTASWGRGCPASGSAKLSPYL